MKDFDVNNGNVTNVNGNPFILNFDDVQVESRKSVKPRAELGGFTLCTIDDVKVEYSLTPKFDKDGKQSDYYFADVKIPRLVVTLKQRHSADDSSDRYFDDMFKIITPYCNDGSINKSFVDMMKSEYKGMMHYCNAVKTLPNYTAPVLDLNFSGDTAEVVASKFDKYFKEFAKALNSADRSNAIFWVKFVACDATNSKTKNQFYGTPRYGDIHRVGEGFIELYVEKKPTSLRFYPTESIVLVAGDKNVKSNNATDIKLGTPMLPDAEALMRKYDGLY